MEEGSKGHKEGGRREGKVEGKEGGRNQTEYIIALNVAIKGITIIFIYNYNYEI